MYRRVGLARLCSGLVVSTEPAFLHRQVGKGRAQQAEDLWELRIVAWLEYLLSIGERRVGPPELYKTGCGGTGHHSMAEVKTES